MLDLRGKKIGLVLTGGGAKGAYHIGCWKTLRLAGITRFAAIAGTSVGAMNAVLISGNEFERAESTWANLRWNDIVTFDPARVLLLPFWSLVYLVSEFSPAVRVISGIQANSVAAAALSTFAFGRLSKVRLLTRRVVLTYVGVSTAPLGRRLSQVITEEQMELMRRSGTRIYGTLSCLRSRNDEEAEWVPRYVRLDEMRRDDLIETLVSGAGIPGLSDPNTSGAPIVDGGLTDNIPIAPIIFDSQNEVDVLIVINTGARFGGMSNGSVTRESLKSWVEAKWRSLHPGASHVVPHLPEVICVTPSESIGGFYKGTCRFSQREARKLMTLGEKDMAAVLEGRQGRSTKSANIRRL